MKHSFIALPLLCVNFVAVAQNVSERPPGYEHLQHFVGHWTEKGNENTFLETCTWYDGNFQVVCNAERKRKDGSTGRSMSILSFVPSQGYVHVGISNRGSYETLQNGTFQDGTFQFLSTATENGKSTVTRIRIGPFTAQGFPFVVDSSTDGSPWTAPDTTQYVRLK